MSVLGIYIKSKTIKPTQFLKAAFKLQNKYQERGGASPGELTWKPVKIPSQVEIRKAGLPERFVTSIASGRM